MKYFRLALILTLILTVHAAARADTRIDADTASASTASTATAGGASTADTASTAGNNSTSNSCDFSAVKNSLFKTESSGAGGYTARGPMTKYGVPLGKYQFIPPTQESMLNKYPDCKGGACHGASLITQPCFQVQECIMDKYLAENLQRIKKDPACQAIMGKTVTGSGQKQTLTCQVTESGLLAGMHLGGPGVCRKISPGGTGPSDNTGTSVAFYVCKHGGLSVPGACTASNSAAASTDNSVPPPVLSAWQLDSLNAVGEGSSVPSCPPGSYCAGTEDSGYVMPVDDPLRMWWVAGLQLMAEQFTASMMAQVEAIGLMFDAKHQLETQRLFQQKTAEAHKDYQPSEQMCTFGTFARDLAATERSADLTKAALAKDVLQRELASGDAKGTTSTSDMLSRIGLFRTEFCDPKDNGSGLAALCPKAPDAALRNRDINYTQTVDQPMTLDINLTDTTTTPDEKAVFALIDNLFAHDLPETLPPAEKDIMKFQYQYMNERSIIAMRGVARNSFANIIALKTATPNGDNASSAPYLKALLREFGLQDDEITATIGKNPSYNAQMELLTKKIYQNPTFYTELYDKPANVKRIRAAMTAIKLMQDRDIQSALQRREMLLSMILELRLRERSQVVYDNALKASYSRR